MAWLVGTLPWVVSMLVGRKITATLKGETLEGSVAYCCQQRVILLPHGCEALF